MKEITQKKKISRVIVKVIVVNIINLVVFLGIVVLLRQLPAKALDVKKANTQMQQSRHFVDSAVLVAETEKNKDKINAISGVLAGDTTVISFIGVIEALKKSGAVGDYEFPVTSEVTDKTGLRGLPVIITALGTKANVSDDLVAVLGSKLLIRPVTLTLTVDEKGIYTAKFGIFLYTQ